MKQSTMTGFAGYLFLNNGTILDLKSGRKVLKANKKGEVTIINDEGVKLTYGMEDIATAIDEAGTWADYIEPAEEGETPATPATPEAPKALTPEQIAAKAERDAATAERKRLKGVLDTATNKVKELVLADVLDMDAIGKAKADLSAAQAEYDSATAKAPKEEKEEESEVLKAARVILAGHEEEMVDAKAYVSAVRTGIENARAAIVALGGKFKKSSAGTGDSVPDRAPKLSYEIAQSIRKDVSEGMTAKDVAAKYGITTTSVTFISKYIQWKLRKGDTAYTPLVNDIYTAGAPMFEDKVREGQEKYMSAENRAAFFAANPDAAKAQGL